MGHCRLTVRSPSCFAVVRRLSIPSPRITLSRLLWTYFLPLLFYYSNTIKASTSNSGTPFSHQPAFWGSKHPWTLYSSLKAVYHPLKTARPAILFQIETQIYRSADRTCIPIPATYLRSASSRRLGCVFSSEWIFAVVIYAVLRGHPSPPFGFHDDFDSMSQNQRGSIPFWRLRQLAYSKISVRKWIMPKSSSQS